jgi:hypothetical protein
MSVVARVMLAGFFGVVDRVRVMAVRDVRMVTTSFAGTLPAR